MTFQMTKSHMGGKDFTNILFLNVNSFFKELSSLNRQNYDHPVLLITLHFNNSDIK